MPKKYNNIPVDDETLLMIQTLCQFYEMGERAQGALVKKLVKADLKRLEIESQPEIVQSIQHIQKED